MIYFLMTYEMIHHVSVEMVLKMLTIKFLSPARPPPPTPGGLSAFAHLLYAGIIFKRLLICYMQV